MSAGRLNRLVTIEKPCVTRNNIGDEIETWIPIGKVWASVEPLNVREFMIARQAQAEVTTKVRMRYYPNLRQTMRLRCGAMTLVIESIINPGMANRWLDILCRGEAEPT